MNRNMKGETPLQQLYWTIWPALFYNVAEEDYKLFPKHPKIGFLKIEDLSPKKWMIEKFVKCKKYIIKWNLVLIS